MDFAVRLARFGERERARQVFTAIVEYRPAEIDAWLWLSELADKLDDQITALEKATQYFSGDNETGNTLQERLNLIRGGPALPTPESEPETAIKIMTEYAQPASRPASIHNEMYQKAERYYLLGNNEKASQLLAALLEAEPTHTDALMLLHELTAEPEKKAAKPEPRSHRGFNPLQTLTRLFLR